MTKKQKKVLYRIGIAFALLLLGLLLPVNQWIKLAVFLVGYAIIGWDILLRAAKNIKRGQVFDENFLMSLATVGAFLVGEYAEGIAVMLFYQVGELFQSYAVNKSRKSIASLMDIRPDSATVIRDGAELSVDPDEVVIGEIILIRPGERVPLDGIVIEGSSMVDTAALTGESVPRSIHSGEEIISGCINQTGILKVQTTKIFGDSTVARILDLVENASSQKAQVENFITRFAKYYTPVVVILAAVLAFIPPIFIPGHPFAEWIHRALTFLVISCPCALVISVPLSFFGGIGRASKYGVLVKGSNYLEVIAAAQTVVFDKTGTLTKGSFEVVKAVPEGITREELIAYAAMAETYSTHPIALSIRRAYEALDAKETLPEGDVFDVQEIAGHGVKASIAGHEVHVGNQRMLASLDIQAPQSEDVGTLVYVVVDHEYAGMLLIADQVKEDAQEAIGRLKKLGVEQCVMLTGDQERIGKKIGEELGLDSVYTQLLPADKVTWVDRFCKERDKKRSVVFVGDGINDAPVLARADVGVAMGGLGSDAAIEAADIVIMTDEPSKLAGVIKIARKTMQICRQNIVFALGVKALVLILGALGFANMWAAVFADVGVSVIAICNSIRTLYMQIEE